jgi:hypothetical protein
MKAIEELSPQVGTSAAYRGLGVPRGNTRVGVISLARTNSRDATRQVFHKSEASVG